jgi:hypothetical protein
MAGKRIEDFTDEDIGFELDQILRDPNARAHEKLKALEMIEAYRKGKPAQIKQAETPSKPKPRPVSSMSPDEREQALTWALAELERTGGIPKPVQAWIS